MLGVLRQVERAGKIQLAWALQGVIIRKHATIQQLEDRLAAAASILGVPAGQARRISPGGTL